MTLYCFLHITLITELAALTNRQENQINLNRIKVLETRFVIDDTSTAFYEVHKHRDISLFLLDISLLLQNRKKRGFVVGSFYQQKNFSCLPFEETLGEDDYYDKWDLSSRNSWNLNCLSSWSYFAAFSRHLM